MKKMSKKNFFLTKNNDFFFIQILIKIQISWILIKYFDQKHHQNHRNSHKFDDFYIKIIDFDEKIKKKSPAAGTLIGNLLKRRACLRRPTASGLKCAEKSDFWKLSDLDTLTFSKFQKTQRPSFSVASGFS